jgi:hypothetical protein
MKNSNNSAEIADEVEFITLSTEDVEFMNGDSNVQFLELAFKEAKSNKGTAPFISLSRGFVQDGQKHYKKSLTLPSNSFALRCLARKLERAAVTLNGQTF